MFKIIYSLNALMMVIAIEISSSSKRVIGYSIFEIFKTLLYYLVILFSGINPTKYGIYLMYKDIHSSIIYNKEKWKEI